MPKPRACPFCGSSKILYGQIEVTEGAYGFRPEHTHSGLIRALLALDTLDFGPEAYFCAACSMIWSKADPRDATKFLQKHATPALKAWLATRPTTPRGN